MDDLVKRQDVLDILYLDPGIDEFSERMIKNLPSVQKWISCSEKLPETDNEANINEYDVLLLVRPKDHPEQIPQIYIGKLKHINGDDGSGNLFKIKIQPCDWTIWGWSYFRKPEVLAWMPLPKFDIGEITNEMR